MDEEKKEVEKIVEVPEAPKKKEKEKEPFKAQYNINERLAIRLATLSGSRPVIKYGSVMVHGGIPESYVSIVLTIAKQATAKNGILVVANEYASHPVIAGSKQVRNKSPFIKPLEKAKDISIPGMSAFVVS